MAAVYSTRFILVDNLDGEAFYDVPEGFVAVIREVDFILPPTISESAVYIGVETAVFFVMTATATETYTPAQWRGRVVANAGESIGVSGNASAGCYVGGYLLSSP